MSWVISGLNEQGEQVVDDCLAAELRQLEAGVWLRIPGDVGFGLTCNDGTGERWVRLKAWFVVVSADWLAAQALGYTPESTSAEHPCGECWWTSLAARKRRGETSCGCVAPRVHTDLQAAAKGLMDAKLSKTALQGGMREAGISKLVSALSPDVIPGADSVLDTPPDVMHLFGCGLSRIEGQWCLEILFNPKAKLAVPDAWAKLRASISALRLSGGKRISKLYATRDGKKWSDMHLDLNATETHQYVMQSVTLVEPLLTEDGRSHPAWKSWLAHRALLAKCLQHAFTQGDVEQVQRLVQEYSDAFDAVPQYRGYERPKHHFLSHLPAALHRFGPFRGFWCMPWEAFLQLIKRMLECSNFRNVAYFICNFWSMMTALRLSTGTRDQTTSDQTDLLCSADCSDRMFTRQASEPSLRMPSCLPARSRTTCAALLHRLRSFERASSAAIRAVPTRCPTCGASRAAASRCAAAVGSSPSRTA